MMLVPPQQSFHCVEVSEAGEVKDIIPSSELSVWVNGGYFVLSPGRFRRAASRAEILSPMPAEHWPAQGKLFGYKHHGFWKPADTFKERAELDAGYHRGTDRGCSGIAPQPDKVDALTAAQ